MKIRTSILFLLVGSLLFLPAGISAHEHSPSPSPTVEANAAPSVSSSPVANDSTESVAMNATSTTVPVMANVPLKWFGIGFFLLLGAFLVWYTIMRRRG